MPKFISKSNNGFSLIEILVSLVLIGVGLLGLGSLQITALKGVTNAHSRTVATMLAMDLSDRMRANTLGVQGGFYGSTISCASADEATACRGTTDCSPEDTAKFDLQEVKCGVKGTTQKYGGVANLLLAGDVSVSCVDGCSSTNAIHDVNISWAISNIHKNQSENIGTMSLTIPVLPN